VSARVSVLLAFLLLFEGSQEIGADPVDFAQLEGTYVSSMLGGCQLQLDREEHFTLSCRGRPECRGRAMPMPSGFALMCRNASQRQSVIWHASLQVDPPRESPPAIRDPTKGPFRAYPPLVEYQEFPPLALWLEPIYWKPRLYLVRHEEREAFCAAVDQGTEPRTTPSGAHFLRVGDHRRRPTSKVPTECGSK